MTPPVKPVDLSDADLYESYRDRGLSHEDAVIHVERRRRASAQPTAERPAPPSALHAAGLSLLYGIRPTFGPEARADLSEARSAHPFASLAGNIVGSVASPVNRFLAPVTKGIGPTAQGTTHGAVLGALQGGAEADPGSKNMGAVLGAAIGGVAGGAGGYVVGKISKPARQMWNNLWGIFSKTDRAVTRSLGSNTAPETVQQVQEAAHRAYLQKQGFAPEVIDRLMTTWRAGGLPKSVQDLRPPAPPVTRPGETISQVSPKGFEVTGTRATPAPPTTPTILEIQTGQQLYQRGGMPDIGRGQTLPYYPRGGRVEQAFGPQPVSSPGVPSQAGSMEHILNALRATPANDLPDALNALRALNVPLGGTDAELIALLTQGKVR